MPKGLIHVKGFKNVIALGFVSFFIDISTEMVLGILPIFILKELGATRAALGLIEGLAEAFGYALRTLSGIFSDRLGKRKAVVFAGYALSTIVKPFLYIARTWSDALTIRVSDRVGKSVRTAPRDALLAESAPEKHMGKAFGLHRTLDQLGAIVGPALAFILIPFIGMRGVFLYSFIPGFMALAVLLLFVEERVGERRKMGILSDIRSVLRRDFTSLLLVLGVFSIGAFNFSFILLKAGELGLPEFLIPVVYATINVSHTAVGIPAGALSDRIGEEHVLTIGYFSFLLASLFCMTLTGNPLYAFIIAAIYGVYMGVIETVQRAMIPKYAPGDLKATAYGLYYAVIGMSFLAANTIVGTLWEYQGIQAAFTYSSVTSILAIIGIVLFAKVHRLGR